MNDPVGHLYASRDADREPPLADKALETLPADAHARRLALPGILQADSRWLYAVDLFNAGYYWEAHEAWEGFWHALGRTTPEAEFVQRLIHLAAACVKIREGKPRGVIRHTERARKLLGDRGDTLGLEPASLAAVLTELEQYTPACWHSSRTPVVRVLVERLRLGV